MRQKFGAPYFCAFRPCHRRPAYLLVTIIDDVGLQGIAVK